MPTLQRLLKVGERLGQIEAKELGQLTYEARQFLALLRNTDLQTNLAHIISLLEQLQKDKSPKQAGVLRKNLIASLTVNGSQFKDAASLLKNVAGTERVVLHVEKREQRIGRRINSARGVNFGNQSAFTKFKPPKFKI